MGKQLLVTTFNIAGYREYGKRMLTSFLRHWPNDQVMVVYHENFTLDGLFQDNPQIILRNLNTVTNLVSFKRRHATNPAAHGYWPPGATANVFKWDAVKFSHKVYALADAFAQLDDKDGMVWLDGDTITHAEVPPEFLDRMAATGDYGLSYLGRPDNHSECGFVGYNRRHPMMSDFWTRFVGLYNSDELFKLEEWHDSFVFDVVRLEFEALGMKNYNITPDPVNNHPFINSDLGLYMDHMKGNRKQMGRSKKHERKIRVDNEPGWWLR